MELLDYVTQDKIQRDLLRDHISNALKNLDRSWMSISQSYGCGSSRTPRILPIFNNLGRAPGERMVSFGVDIPLGGP